MNWPRLFALDTIRALGYEVRRVVPPTDSVRDVDPITIDYLLSQRGHTLLHVPIADARGLHALGLRFRSDTHPFVRACDVVKGNSQIASQRHHIRTCLTAYYALTQPASALDVVDLNATKAPGLFGQPAFNYLLPWWESSLVEIAASREKALRQIAMRNRIDPHGKGHPFFGPLTGARLDLEVERLAKLLTLTKRHGFKSFLPRSPMKVAALRSGHSYRWIVEQGQHRFALAATLGLAELPAMLLSIVRREDAAFWPQVKSGIYTESGALDLFDRLFQGEPSSTCSKWLASIRSSEPSE